MAKFKLNLKSFFAKEGNTIVKSYKRLLSTKRGVENDSAPPNAASTVKKKGFSHWLQDTGETKKEGFKSKTTSSRLLIFASGKRHSGKYTSGGKRKTRSGSKPTYRELFEYHNKDRYSGVFGQLPVGSNTIKKLDKEVTKQLNEYIDKNFPKRIRIGK
jgi:hypothetical protein